MLSFYHIYVFESMIAMRTAFMGYLPLLQGSVRFPEVTTPSQAEGFDTL